MIAEPIRIRRKNAFNLFREGQKLTSFDEFPMLRPDVDPQLHVSNNKVDQPFYLICEKDTVLAQMTGQARIAFREGSVRYFDLSPGDFVYVPGGTAHRILTLELGLQIRYKAREPGLEAVVWYCEKCGSELDRFVWNVGETSSQAGYHHACLRHNEDVARRRCLICDLELPPVDLGAFRWKAIADSLSHDNS